MEHSGFKRLSADGLLSVVYLLLTALLGLLGETLGHRTKLVIVLCSLFAAVAVSWKHKMRSGWKRPPVDSRDAVFGWIYLLMATLLFCQWAIYRQDMFSRMVDGLLLLGQLITIKGLQTLRIIAVSQDEFLRQCSEVGSSHSLPTGVRRPDQRAPTVKMIYEVYVVSLLLVTFSLLALSERVERFGATSPSPSRTTEISINDSKVYVSESEKLVYRIALRAYFVYVFVGIASWIIVSHSMRIELED